MTEQHNAAEWLIDRHVNEGRGDRIAIRCEGVDTTYSDLLAEMTRAQAALDELEVKAGQRVVLVLNDDAVFPAWFLGAMRSGVVPVPISTMLKGSELAPIIADCGAVTLVISHEYSSAVADVAAGTGKLRNVVVVGGPATGGETANLANTNGDSTNLDNTGVRVLPWESFRPSTAHSAADTTIESPAFWLYSSGTTGTPKGVMHRHGSLRETANSYGRDVLQISASDRFLSVAKLFFAYGLGNSLTFPFSVGATAILHPQRPTPGGLLALIEQEAPSLFFASPGFLAALLDTDAQGRQFESIRATMTAGESLPADVQKRFAALSQRPVLDGIGTTELLHIFISNTLDSQTPGSSGHPVPGYEVQLRNDDGELITEPETPGFLHVKGPSAAIGYHNRPEANAAAFRDGWVRTGDVYTQSGAGAWTFLGRNNDMIKAGGIWVSPAEVESALIGHPEVLEVAVVGARNAADLEEVVAFIVPVAGADPSTQEIDAYCRTQIAAFKRPRRIVVVDELPKTATGKIQRYALRDQLTRNTGND